MTALSYTVRTSPSPLPISTATGTGRAVLRIAVTNPGPTPVTCDTITVTLPTGTGADALTCAPEKVKASTDRADWSVEHRGGGVFQVRPVMPGAELKPGTRFAITFADIEINRTAGTATLGISESSKRGTGPRERTTDHWRFAKAAPTALLSDFLPDQVDVPNPGTVTLTWKCEQPQAGNPKYELFYGEERKLVNDHIVDGNGSWTSPPLHAPTAFMLLAETKVDNAPVTYGLTTAVTVKVPDLDVGNLEANGTVRLFGEAQQLVAGGSDNVPKAYVADTDGVVSGYVKTLQNNVLAELNIFVTPLEPKAGGQKRFSTQSWDARGGTDNQEASLFVPVPRDSVVRVVSKGNGGFDADVTWFPFGTGPLREIES